MDSGEEIPCLNEEWTFAGAKANEWIAGIASMVILTEVANINAARSMPLLLFVWIMTTFALALLRRQFLDQERGVRNYIMNSLGLPPPGIPRPASLQPYWSGAPMRKLKDDSWFSRLELQEMLELSEEAKDDNRE